MSAAKHTPGPWETKPEEVGRAYIRIRATIAGSRFKVANVLSPIYGDGYSPSDRVAELEMRETRANARLIAAAPDLLEALQGLHELAALLAANCADRVKSDGDPRWKASLDAIAKATGA